MTQLAAARSPAPGFAKHPGYRIDFLDCAKRVRVRFNGETIADSTAVTLMRETRHVPVYYFPRADVRQDLFARTDHATHCPFKGDAAYWTVSVGGRSAENAVWSYEDPFDESAAIKGYMAFYWARMDGWLEEDEEVFVHARDPLVRVDILQSSRRVRVELAGEVLADTTRGRFLFETGLPTRYYVPREDVRMDLLQRSDTKTACPYKGTAGYWTARIRGRTYEDVAWCYADPLPECGKIRGCLAFYPDRVDVLTVDGEAP